MLRIILTIPYFLTALALMLVFGLFFGIIMRRKPNTIYTKFSLALLSYYYIDVVLGIGLWVAFLVYI